MPTKVFGTVRQKIFDGKLWYPISAWNFSIPQSFWNIEGMPTKIFGTVRPKILEEKNVIPPFSAIKFFGTRNFLQNSRIPLWKFSALWDIKILTETHDMNLLSIFFFRYQKISGKQKGYFTKLLVSVLWDKSSYKTVMTPFPMHANLRWRSFLKHQSFL